MHLRELAAAVPGAILTGDPETVVSEIQFDSRLIEPGSLFVALRGGYLDGHDFIADAAANGAAAISSEIAVDTSLPVLVVPDTRVALPAMAATFFRHPSRHLKVVGITGTDGKTTTSYLAESIFESAGYNTGMIGTVSVKIAGHIVQHETRQTTPESLEMQRLLAQMVRAGVDWAFIEATSHGLALHRLDEVEFKIAAVTNITHEHLEFHQTIPEYRAAKASLFSRVGRCRGVAVVNMDDEGARSVLQKASGAAVLTFSAKGADADLTATRICSDSTGNRFELTFRGESVNVMLPLLGAFNVENALAASGVALAAGIPLAVVTESLARAPAVPGRLEPINEGQPFQVIVDYAHTPESLKKLLELLRELNRPGRLICVSGSAGERDVEKRALQGRVSAGLADLSIFTSEDPRFEDAGSIILEIAAGAESVKSRVGQQYVCITDREEAIRFAIGEARSGDVVVLAGKGHERSIIWGNEKRPWNESEVARKALADLGYGAPS